MRQNNLLLARKWQRLLRVENERVPHGEADRVLYDIILQIILVLPLTQSREKQC